MLRLLALLQEHAAPAGAPSSPFEVNFGLFFWTWVVFISLMLLLKKFAWPALLKSTVEREQRIEQQLAQAEKANAEAAALLAQQKTLLAEGRATAQTMMTEAKALAEKERTAAMERTRQEQADLLERARRDIMQEKERAIQELKREAVDISLAAAGRLIQQRLTSETDRKLVEGYLASLESSK
jgi:F-type H+-transporting ATPase subunit b